MPRTRGLKGIEHGQPDVLTVRMDKQRRSLWISGLSTDLNDPFDVEGCRRKINELGLNDRNRNDYLFPTLPNNWAAG